jgi:hypothetical protein
MKAREREQRDWFFVPLILGIGFFFVILAGQWALRFSPSWALHANMSSNLDPNSDFLTRRPSGWIEPVDPAILTEPIWINLYLTPGAKFSTGTPIPIAGEPFLTTPTLIQPPPQTSTSISISAATNTHVVITSPTNTFVYSLPASTFTSTPKSKPSATSTAFPAFTATLPFAATATQTSIVVTATQSSTATSTPSATATPTGTSAATATPTATPTPTNTSDPIEPDFGGPDGNVTPLGNGTSIEFNLNGFLLDGNSAWDTVYYEQEEASAAGKIHLGAVKLEVYDQTTAAWYTIYDWGDGVSDTNASYNNGNSEPDGFPIDKSLLYGAPPLNTGIAIDIDTPAIGQGGSVGDSITTLRITSLSNAHCEVDSLQMLR